MKNTLYLFIFLLLGFNATGQQDPHYTLFAFNKLAYNPAYAGSRDAACLSAIIRSQWIGLDGAPNTQALSFNMPLVGQRVGVGGNLVRTTIGITEKMTLDGIYAYRARLGQGMLGIGAQISVRYLRSDFTNITATQAIDMDGAIPVGIQSKFLPNFGMGAYYNTEKFYVGFSIPRLLKNNIDLSDREGVISREVNHFYMMAGLIIPAGEKIKLQPQLMLKYTPTAPFDAEINLNAWIMDRFMLGVNYRTGGSTASGAGESLDALVAIQLADNILFGVSYDITLSDLKNYQSGSVEAVLRYCIGKGDSDMEYTNPRFF